MHDIARSATEDGVELVLAGSGKAPVAAMLVARKLLPEIPAPWSLAEVAGDGTDVPDLRRGRGPGGFGQNLVLARDKRVRAELAKRDQAANADPARLCGRGR